MQPLALREEELLQPLEWEPSQILSAVLLQPQALLSKELLPPLEWEPSQIHSVVLVQPQALLSEELLQPLAVQVQRLTNYPVLTLRCLLPFFKAWYSASCAAAKAAVTPSPRGG